MQNPQIQTPHIIPAHHSEEILVVKRSILLSNDQSWSGINPAIFDKCIDTIQTKGAFIPRSHAETNPEYKQIIPYILFTCNNKLFVMQRKTTASESRLANKYSLGIGGHIRQEDITNNNVFDWAQREFDEEVSYQGNKKMMHIGILNDDSNEVGKVHLGIVLLIKGDSEQISIKDEHKAGYMMTLEECKTLKPNMENWSLICLEMIEKMNLL